MQKSLYSLVLSLPVLTGCYSPLKIDWNTTRDDLKRRLSQDYHPKEKQEQADLVLFGNSNLNYFYEEMLMHPTLYHKWGIDEPPNLISPANAIGPAIDEFIDKVSDEGSFVDVARDEVKKAGKWLEDLLNIKGWKVRPISGSSIGIRATHEF